MSPHVLDLYRCIIWMTFLALLQKETMGVSFPLFPIVGPIVKLYHHRPSILHLVEAVYKRERSPFES